MSGSSKAIIVYALALSGLAHGLLFYYHADELDYGEIEAEQSYISVKLYSTKPSVKQDKVVKTADNDTEKSDSKEIVQVKALAGNHISEKKIEKTKSVKQQDRSTKEDAISEAETKKQSGESRVLLLSLLHKEINAHKEYPYMAVRQRREGRVKINFMLHPDGKISDISIVESSHYSLLDAAARLAVQSVSPLQVAENYLQQSELFDVDIEFRLN